MKAPFQTEEPVGIFQHASSEKPKLFDDLARNGSVNSVGGIATRGIFSPLAESFDPYITSIACAGLAMQSASGIASAKVGKRKSRAIRKPPMKVFSADSSNFMAMVHCLTGFESSPFLLAGSPQASVLKPFAAGAGQYTFTQGVYVPERPAAAGDKMIKSFSNDTFSCESAQLIPSCSARKQLGSISDDDSVSTKEGLFSTSRRSSPSGTDHRLPAPHSHHPFFKQLQAQVSTHGDNWDCFKAGFLRNRGDSSTKEDCTKEESGLMSLFREERRLHEGIGAVRQ